MSLQYHPDPHIRMGQVIADMRARFDATADLDLHEYRSQIARAEAEDAAKIQREARQVATFDTAIKRGLIRPSPVSEEAPCWRWMFIAAPIFGVIAAAVSFFVRF